MKRRIDGKSYQANRTQAGPANVRGPVFAIVTPFDSGGAIDFGALEAYLDFLRQAGVPDLIINGTTGEFASMTFDERKSILEFCRQHFAGSLTANISACSVKDCLSLLEHAAQGHADAALLLPPYYHSDATFEGLVTFFCSVMKKSTVPVFLYNFPRHTNIEIKPKLLTTLAAMDVPMVGIKDSSGKLETALGFKSAVPNMQVLVGSDSLASKTLDAGLDGSVTGAGNAVPECLLQIVRSYSAGQREKAQSWQKVLDEWRAFRRGLPEVSGIASIKAGLAARITGFPTFVRPPFSPAEREVVSTIAGYVTGTMLPAIQDAAAE